MASIDRIRNLGVIAHIDAGKTTVSERFLFHAGRIHRTGEVHDGQAQLDWMEQERERGITITAAATTLPWRGHDVHLLDTPGHVDFTIEVERCLRVLDGAIVVFCGVGGVQAQTETVWRQADRFAVPRLAFVNKLDRAGASFARVVEEIRARLRANAVPVQVPIGSGAAFAGAVDLVHLRAVTFTGEIADVPVVGPVPDAMRDEVADARERLVAALAEVDDGVAERYLADRAIDPAAVAAALRRAVVAGRLVPVLAGSALRNKGIEPLLDAVVDWLPSPADLPPARGVDPAEPSRTLLREPRDAAPLAALAFKVAMREGRRTVFVRVFSGRLEKGAEVLCARTGRTEKVARLFVVHADQRTAVDAAGAGAIVAVAGLREAATGDTLCDPEAPILLERIDANVPVLAQSIEVEHHDERQRLQFGLGKLCDEDPTLRTREDEGTGETIVEGMGELHLEVALDRLRREYGVDARLGRPQVLCRETVRGTGDGAAVFERALDGRAIFGEVACRVAPVARGAGRTLRQDPALAAHPDHVVAAAMAGLGETAAQGRAGDPLDDCEIALTAIGTREGADAAIGVRAAAAEALRRAVAAAQPVSLEPVMRVEVEVDARHLGAVLGDLQQRHGRVAGVDDRDERSLVRALVPLRALFGYASRLRSITEGHGTFSMHFAGYDTPA